MNILEILAEQKIQEAIRNGVFDKLPGRGKPIQLQDLSNVPAEDRMAYTILKNSGVLPPEMQVREAIHELEKKIDDSVSEDDKVAMRLKLNKMQTLYNIMMEKRKR